MHVFTKGTVYLFIHTFVAFIAKKQMPKIDTDEILSEIALEFARYSICLNCC